MRAEQSKHPDDEVAADDEGGADDEGDAGSQADEVPPPKKAGARVRKGAKRQVKTRRGRGGRPSVGSGRLIKEYAAFRSSLDFSPHLNTDFLY